MRDSNPRPSVCKTDTLATELIGWRLLVESEMKLFAVGSVGVQMLASICNRLLILPWLSGVSTDTFVPCVSLYHVEKPPEPYDQAPHNENNKPKIQIHKWRTGDSNSQFKLAKLT